jgi:hypothetical protein
MPQPGTRLWAGRAVVAVAALTAAACSHLPNLAKPDVTSSSAPTTSASPSDRAVSSSQQVFPLTGLPAPSPAAAARPSVALLVGGPAPQGLGSADVVFEEATAPVRYVAVYQSRGAADVGPITTTQPSDRELLPLLHPVVGYDGAVTTYISALLGKTKNITDAGYGTDPSLYTSGPAGLTTSTQAIAGAGSKDPAPPPLYTYRGTGSAGTSLAGSGQWHPTSATLTIPGLGTQTWTFDAHADRWTLTSGGPRVQAANLVVQTVSYSTHVLNPKHGTSVPVLQLIGSGHAEVLSGSAGGSAGTAASGTWSRQTAGQVTNYFDASGSPMAFLPGPTWVVLAPAGTQVRTSG